VEASATNPLHVGRVLVMGATGYIGKNTLQPLFTAGYSVRAAARDPRRIPGPDGIERVAADVADAESVRAALVGVQVAYYFVHTLGGGADYQTRDREAARIFGEEAAAAGVERIIYLGGLGEDVDGGFTLCRELRVLSATVPILFLSARDSDFDIVSGLRIGADDYLTKDTSLPHLTARIAALFRRSDLVAAPVSSEDVLTRGKLTLDLKRLTAFWEGKRVELTLTEFWMVHALAKFPGHVKDRDGLMRDARIVVDDSTITSHVKRIRRKFATLDPAFDRIETVYGMGYRWDAEDA